MRHIWWIGKGYALAMPADDPFNGSRNSGRRRSYLYLIKHDFRDVKFKIRIRPKEKHG